MQYEVASLLRQLQAALDVCRLLPQASQLRLQCLQGVRGSHVDEGTVPVGAALALMPFGALPQRLPLYFLQVCFHSITQVLHRW